MTKKILLSLLIILLLAVGIFFLTQGIYYARSDDSYRTFLIPRAELSVVDITYLSLDTTRMMSKILIHSPLPFDLGADSLQYTLYISGVEVLKSTRAQSVNIRKRDSTMIELPVTVYGDTMVNILNRLEKSGKDSAVYEIKTTFYSHGPLKKKFNWEIDKLLPLIYIPTLKVKDVNFDSLNFKGVTLYLHTLIGNKNLFPLDFNDVEYKFQFADNPWVSGVKEKIRIDEESKTPVVLPVRISFKEIGQTIGPLIRKGKNLPYQLKMEMKMESDLNALKNSRVVMQDAGTLEEMIDLTKEAARK